MIPNSVLKEHFEFIHSCCAPDFMGSHPSILSFFPQCQCPQTLPPVLPPSTEAPDTIMLVVCSERIARFPLHHPRCATCSMKFVYDGLAEHIVPVSKSICLSEILILKFIPMVVSGSNVSFSSFWRQLYMGLRMVRTEFHPFVPDNVWKALLDRHLFGKVRFHFVSGLFPF